MSRNELRIFVYKELRTPKMKLLEVMVLENEILNISRKLYRVNVNKAHGPQVI